MAGVSYSTVCITAVVRAMRLPTSSEVTTMTGNDKQDHVQAKSSSVIQLWGTLYRYQRSDVFCCCVITSARAAAAAEHTQLTGVP